MLIKSNAEIVKETKSEKSQEIFLFKNCNTNAISLINI